MSLITALKLHKNTIKNINLEEKFFTLLDNAPFCIHEITTEGRIINISKAGLKMINMKSSEVENKDYFSFIDIKDRARIKKLFKKAINGETVEFTYKLNIANKEIYCLSNFIPLKKMPNNLWHLMGTTHDVTDKRLAELKYDRRKQQFYQFMDDLPIGITNINKEYKFTFINKFFNDKVLNINDAMGKTLYNIKDQLMSKTLIDIIGKEGFLPLKPFIDKAFQGESSTVYDYQPKFNSYFLTKILPLYDKNNNVKAVQTASIDVTEKKIFELKKLEQTRLIDNIPVAVSIYNLDKKLIDANQNYLDILNKRLGKEMTKKDLMNKTVAEFLGKEGSTTTKPYFKKAFNGAKQKFTHYQPKLKAYIFSIFLPNYNEKKQISSVTAICLDITELEQNKNKLKTTIDQITNINTELENYNYILAHDLREPIRAISISNELLEKTLTDDKEKMHLIDQIRHNTEFIDNLICNLLDYHNIDKIDLKKSSDLKLILDEIIANYNSITDKKINITTNIRTHIINMNKLHLRQLLQNIISNAIKYNDNNEIQLEINVLIKDKEQIIAIKDNGIGIHDKFSKQLTDDKNILSKNQQVNGLGLIICKRIIELYKGKITAQPHACGSVFTIHIPI